MTAPLHYARCGHPVAPHPGRVRDTCDTCPAPAVGVRYRPILPGTHVHGTPSMYNRGCRCEVCRAGNLRRINAIKADLHARMEEAPHGTPSAYQNWGCRCEPCIKANSEKNQNRRARAGVPTKTGPWTAEEMALAARYDLTAIEIARMLGRSYASVTGARQRLIRAAGRSS